MNNTGLITHAIRAWVLVRDLPAPLLVSSAAGWILLAAFSSTYPLASLCMAVPHIDKLVAAEFKVMLELADPRSLALSWLAMLLATMPPLLAGSLSHVWRRSFATRRARAVALFVLGYTTLWLATGVALAVFAVMLSSIGLILGLPAPVLAGLVALLWQATPSKQIALNRCHGRPPLAPYRLAADLSALRYGLVHGASCASACWSVMLLPLLTDGALHWFMMVALAMVLLLERLQPPRLAHWGAALRGPTSWGWAKAA